MYLYVVARVKYEVLTERGNLGEKNVSFVVGVDYVRGRGVCKVWKFRGLLIRKLRYREILKFEGFGILITDNFWAKIRNFDISEFGNSKVRVLANFEIS